jgi:predicted ATPase
MLVRGASIPEALRPDTFDAWPYSVPCVAELAEQGLRFESPITFLIGENGSGKSTLVEAIAEGFKLDAHGGRAGRKYGNDRPKTPLGEVLRLETTAAGSRMLSGPRNRKRGSSSVPRQRSAS